MVMVVVGVVLALAAPNMRNLVVGQRVKTAVSDLHVSLTFARSEAIKRNGTVDVVPVDAANWSLGWSVRSGATVLASQDPYQSLTFTGPAGNVSYLGTGRISGTATVSFFIKATDHPAVRARCVHVDPSGRPAVRMDNDGDSSDGVCD